MTFFAYARVSTDEQNPEGQIAALKAHWQQGPATLGEFVEVIDRGVSGGTPFAARPLGSQVLRAMKPGDTLAVTKLDRAFRSVLDALTTIAAWDRQGVFLTVLNFNGTTLGTATPMGRFMLTMVAAFGELERGMASERTRERLAQRKAAGVLLGGVPFGYKRQGASAWVPHPDEYPILAHIAYLSEIGVHPKGIALDLNRKGMTNRRGNPWDASGVSKIVRALRAGQSPMTSGVGETVS